MKLLDELFQMIYYKIGFRLTFEEILVKKHRL